MRPLWIEIAKSIGKELNESFIWEQGIYKIQDNGMFFWDKEQMGWMVSKRIREFLNGLGDVGTLGETCYKCGKYIKNLPVDAKFCPYCTEKIIKKMDN